MRIPAALLPHRVTLYPLAAASGRGGAVKGAGMKRRALVEHKSALRVDQRSTSETTGTEIVANVRVILQAADYVPPGSRIKLADGAELQVVNARKVEHPNAPSNAELWGV